MGFGHHNFIWTPTVGFGHHRSCLPATFRFYLKSIGLDEATSALDATSRILVFEALKRWRRNKITIVITHDLSQIESGDFVYVLKDGRVVEQSFRYDLESVSEEEDGRGEFRKMMERQNQTGGFLPEKDVAVAATVDVEDVLKQ